MNYLDAVLNIDKVSKSYGESHILNSISFDVQKNTFLTILGPSGCGKSTLLRLLSGLESPSNGRILYKGRDITHDKANQRPFNTIFQRYALFPHMNIYENVAFGLRVKRIKEKEIDERVMEVLRLVNLIPHLQTDISRLSGGQQQRVAIARAIINRPKVLLLDEPLSALDLKLRKEMQWELKKLKKNLSMIFIFVTHDQEEALALSDQVIVMNEGQIQQIGSPEDIYNTPYNAFVADFIGESNIIEGKMIKDYWVHFLGSDYVCDDKDFASQEHVHIVIRPEDIQIKKEEEYPLKGYVVSSIFQGVHYEMQIQTPEFIFLVHSTQEYPIRSRVSLYLNANSIHVMPYTQFQSNRESEV